MSTLSFLVAAVMILGTVGQAFAIESVPVMRVPEPATGLLMLAGVAGGAAFRYFKSR